MFKVDGEGENVMLKKSILISLLCLLAVCPVYSTPTTSTSKPTTTASVGAVSTNRYYKLLAVTVVCLVVTSVLVYKKVGVVRHIADVLGCYGLERLGLNKRKLTHNQRRAFIAENSLPF